ncbi:MAG: HK97 gp10 family phage protein [Clostridium sp.]|nr:HK97 gp10 family phage protein [Clostridium sp.]MCM1547926.1 HK97 gp10 family phage protein [Ruminococcus sp.]
MADSMRIEITDNSPKAKEELEAAVLRALEECGQDAEKYAKMLAPSPGKTGTGALRNSIAHQVAENEQAVYIGTNSEYAVYLELGTGKYYPGGRQEPWVYQDAKGNWHLTHGQRAQPYLKPAVADHADHYRSVIKKELKNG